MKFWRVLHNIMTNHLLFTDIKYIEICQIHRHIKILTVFCTSSSDFAFFEVSDFKAGVRLCDGLSDSPISGFFDALLKMLPLKKAKAFE